MIFVLFSVMAAATVSHLVLRWRGSQPAVVREEERHFIGSGTWCAPGETTGKASWPLVRLDILQSGLVVGPTSRWLRRMVPHVELRWADISCVESRPTGVRINLKGSGDPSLLFQLHRDAVLATLRRYPIELRA